MPDPDLFSGGVVVIDPLTFVLALHSEHGGRITIADGMRPEQAGGHFLDEHARGDSRIGSNLLEVGILALQQNGVVSHKYFLL